MHSAFSFPVNPVLTRRPRRSKFLCCHPDGNTSGNGNGADKNDESTTSRRAFLSGVARLSGATSILSVTRDAFAATEGEAVAFAASTSGAKTARKLTWGYVDEIGPDKWGQLSDDWRACDAGKLQSPIELSYKSSRLAGLNEFRPTIALSSSSVPGRTKFGVRHKEPGPNAANKWLVIEPYVEPPPSIIGDAPPLDVPAVKSPLSLTLPNVGKYRLRKIHFHTDGSEHVLNGQRSAMEAHFVFGLDTPVVPVNVSADPVSVMPEKGEEPRGTGASFVVVGVLINQEETTSRWLTAILDTAIRPDGGTGEKNDDLYSKSGAYLELDMDEVLPNFNVANLYTYDGSLTTPPGTEGIHWIVMNDRAAVTKQDCQALQEFQGGPNTRPLQNPNDREVVQFASVVAEESDTAPV